MSSSNPQTLKSTTLAMVFSKYRSCCWNPTWLGCWLFVDHHLFGGKNKAIFTMKFGGSVISSHSKHRHIWLVKHLGPPTLGYTMGRFLPDLSPTLHTIRKGSRPVQITLLRVIPTLAFQVIYSDICFDILPNILSDIYSDILSGISSSILSGIYFGVLSGIYSGILCGILSRIYFGILCGIYSGSLSGIYAGSLSGIYSGIPSGRWGPAVPTELGRSQVEVQRCPLRAEVGEEIGEELARRKWTWKWRQRWWRRRRRTSRRRTRRRRRTTVIKSNNPHLAGGEKWMLSSGSKRTPVVLLRTCSKTTNLWDQI